MEETDHSAELEQRLAALKPADLRWARGQQRRMAQRQRRGQPVDRLQAALETRLQEAEAALAARRARVPTPGYDPALPITAHREAIIEAIRQHPVVVVAGETGSGKTTQLPKFCLEAGRGLRGLIGCTQPRRIAARAMAARVAEELGQQLGELVGYQVRFREQLGEHSLMKFMTDGILLAEAVGDRQLERYDTIIIDEAHERSLNIDFLLGYLKQLLRRRPDLRVVITSATIDTEKFSRHFDGAPVIEVSGRGYPVETRYQPLHDTPDADEKRDDRRDLYRGIVEAVHQLDRIDARGDILVFLSGEREIHEARDALARAGLRQTEVLPLYARLSAAEQQRVFHPGAARRIILATNVAETSLTVPRIRFVIDSGLARISRYAHRSRIQRLPIEAISQASANQRSGRCGRLGPGTCIRLYSEEDFQQRPEFTEPEILRTSLASVILRMLTMGLGAVEAFPFIDPPAPRMINDARQLLQELGALDAQRELTPLGRRLARWPLDVRLGRMVLAGEAEGCLEQAMVLAAGLSIQDPRERPLEAQAAADEQHARFADDSSDFAAMLALWDYLRGLRKSLSGSQFRKRCKREFLAPQRVLEWFDLYQQLRDLAREEGLRLTGQRAEGAVLHQALLAGLLSHVGRRHPEERHYDGARNRSFHIFPGSNLFGKSPQWIVAAEIVETSKPYARINAKVAPEWIEAQAAHLLKRAYFEPHWSRRRGQVMAWEQVSLFGLILRERRLVAYTAVDASVARRLFIEHALVRGELDSRAPFLDANRRAREAVERLEHKRRQRDVLADEAALYAFFDAQLPAQIATAKSFARWLEGLDAAALKRLQLGEEVLLREDAGLAPLTQYPDHWTAGDRQLPLSYLFSPGDAADGVSLSVPLTLLNTVQAEHLRWQVPGLRRELIMELLRTLPKPQRRMLTPLPQFADLAAAALPAEPSGDLLVAIVTVLEKEAGVALQPADFDFEALPLHLRPRILVTDDDGELLAEGRDLAALQARFGARAQRAFMDEQGREWQRDGIVAWLPGDLPEEVTTDDGSRAWPALVDQEDAVGLRLFDTWEEAALSQQEGILRLLSLTLADKMRWMQRQHGLARDGLLAWTAVGEVDALLHDLAWRALQDTVGNRGQHLRREDDWHALLEQVRRELGPVFQGLARQLSSVLQRWGHLRRLLEQAGPPLAAETLADLAAQLDDLIYPGFLLELGEGRFPHYPRYLEGAELRWQRAQEDPGRDLRTLTRFAPFWARYEQALETDNYTRALDDYRWLLAEFRVSLFAQQLKTDGKVSEKRLTQAWQAVLARREQ